jgi:4-hydroxybutyryl-CoA dehydratase/vinylacetyl-CoA-Delta-isomerase
MTRILGTDRNAVVRDKLVEMVHMNETTFASAIGASAMGYELPCGSFMVDPMAANPVKQNITRNVYQIGRLSHDLAGGFLATMPDQKSLDDPEIGPYIRKYHQANPDYDVMERVKVGRYIENMTSVTTLVEAMHGAGSPQAQRIVMLGQAGIEEKIELANRVIDGTDDVAGLPLPGRGDEPTTP